MVRFASVLVVAAALAGCGLAGTTAATGAGAASSAEQARQAPKQLEGVQERLDAAQKTEADARAAAERAAE
jgi:hypothetical protein